jgi:hypothetical protein
MQGNVQSIDALRDLHHAAEKLGAGFGELSFDLKAELQRTDQWINETAPAYWRSQLKLAQQKLSEAQDNLALTQATYGGRDKPAATEAKQRVVNWRRRVATCEQKLKDVKRWASELERSKNTMVTTCSNLQQYAESDLPDAARQLAAWISALDTYTDNAGRKSE